MEAKIRYKTVDSYISSFPPKVRSRLNGLRTAIKEAAPEAEEKISYNMPAYTQKGMLLYFAAHRNHVGLYPMQSAISAFKDDLSEYYCSKGTVQFPHDKPLPLKIIQEIVKFRMIENTRKAELKGKRKKSSKKIIITVEVVVNVPLLKAWNIWISPEHIIKWYYATETWHTPRAENDVRKGGKFLFRMEAKDGSFGFDFEGVYKTVKSKDYLEYSIPDGRRVKITFETAGKTTKIIESFEAENINSVETQEAGWKSILENFKKYAEQV